MVRWRKVKGALEYGVILKEDGDNSGAFHFAELWYVFFAIISF